jgi:chromosome partitioning protein
MIVAIANQNGEAEKSILANNLAALRMRAGRSVLLIDSDPKKLSFDWSAERKAANIKPLVPVRSITAKGLQPEIENLGSRYQDIVIDTESRDCLGSRSALIAARTLVVPLQSKMNDVVSQNTLIARIHTARFFNPGLRVIFVITRAKNDPLPDDLAWAQAIAARVTSATLAKTILHDDTIHTAFDKGLCISEYKPEGDSASREMTDLYQEVFNDSYKSFTRHLFALTTERKEAP